MTAWHCCPGVSLLGSSLLPPHPLVAKRKRAGAPQHSVRSAPGEVRAKQQLGVTWWAGPIC